MNNSLVGLMLSVSLSSIRRFRTRLLNSKVFDNFKPRTIVKRITVKLVTLWSHGFGSREFLRGALTFLVHAAHKYIGIVKETDNFRRTAVPKKF